MSSKSEVLAEVRRLAREQTVPVALAVTGGDRNTKVAWSGELDGGGPGVYTHLVIDLSRHMRELLGSRLADMRRRHGLMVVTDHRPVEAASLIFRTSQSYAEAVLDGSDQNLVLEALARHRNVRIDSRGVKFDVKNNGPLAREVVLACTLFLDNSIAWQEVGDAEHVVFSDADLELPEPAIVLDRSNEPIRFRHSLPNVPGLIKRYVHAATETDDGKLEELERKL